MCSDDNAMGNSRVAYIYIRGGITIEFMSVLFLCCRRILIFFWTLFMPLSQSIYMLSFHSCSLPIPPENRKTGQIIEETTTALQGYLLHFPQMSIEVEEFCVSIPTNNRDFESSVQLLKFY